MNTIDYKKACKSKDLQAFVWNWIPTLSGWPDSNGRPHAPQTCTLTGLSYIPNAQFCANVLFISFVTKLPNQKFVSNVVNSLAHDCLYASNMLSFMCMVSAVCWTCSSTQLQYDCKLSLYMVCNSLSATHASLSNVAWFVQLAVNMTIEYTIFFISQFVCNEFPIWLTNIWKKNSIPFVGYIK